MTQATQPKVEWGFYAITPRIVRTQYKDLSHAEKWLYVCLKDLCGEKGVCYRTLRSLSEETNISIASLSSMIPNLQKAGLIHAEKKKRSNSGKEIWHISIVDIWQANHEYCSKIEQSGQVVQNLNNDVQNLNEVSQDCSENERVCSDFPYRRITPEEETITEERTIEEREVADATARSQSSSQNDLSEDTVKREAVKASQKESGDGTTAILPDCIPDRRHMRSDIHSDIPAHSQQQKEVADASLTSQTERRKDTNKVTEPPAPRKPPSNPIPKRPKQQGIVLMDEIPGDAIPEKAIAIMDRWDRVHKKPAPRTIKTIQAAQLLMVYDPSEDELRDCEKWLYTTDRPGKPWYRSHGVHLPDIAEKIGSWQSLQNAPPTKPEKEPSNEHKASNFYSADALFERNKWKTEAFLAEYEAKSAAKQEVQS